MTRALILAAGRGERMRPLTDSCPKPLLAVRGKPLMQWHMEALARGGCTGLVVNTAWLGDQITSHFGPMRPLDGGRLLSISYSNEQADFGGALETAGGIARALPLLQAGGQDLFWLVAGDVYAPDFNFDPAAVQRFAASNALAHLWLVPNPAHNPRGDFGISPEGLALNQTEGERYTYSTIGLYRAALFAEPFCSIPHGNPDGIPAPLAPLLRRAMDEGRISASLYSGRWTDVGTPERLAELNR
jgi:MurNAc alpha-1-phosphate uridylyltransferase